MHCFAAMEISETILGHVTTAANLIRMRFMLRIRPDVRDGLAFGTFQRTALNESVRPMCIRTFIRNMAAACFRRSNR